MKFWGGAYSQAGDHGDRYRVVAYLYGRSRSRGNHGRRPAVITAIALALIVLIFVPIPHLNVADGNLIFQSTESTGVTGNVMADSYNATLNVVQPGAFRSDDPTSWYS